MSLKYIVDIFRSTLTSLSKKIISEQFAKLMLDWVNCLSMVRQLTQVRSLIIWLPTGFTSFN